MKKTLGFATTSGQDYEVFLCCLTFLRALRLTSGDFFLVSNHAQAGKFDDVVLFYRLKGDQGPEYRAILLQAKHRGTFKENKLTSSYPFSLREYLESFEVVRKLAEQPVNVESRSIELQEFSLVLYTNTGCEIAEAAVDVTNVPQVQHLKDILNTKGRLLRISEAQRVKLPEGEETSDFLSHLILCTDQTGVDKADQFVEEELRSVLKLTSQDIVRKLTSELKRVVRDWWREGTVRYLTPWCDEWKKVLEMEITRLNGDTLNIDQKLNLEFSEASVVQFEVVHRRLKKSWICVRDEYQAMAVRSRLLRAQRNSLVIGVKTLDDHWEEVEALWGNNICSTLVLDLSKGSPEEGSPLLQRLQEAVVQSDAGGRRLVVIAKIKPTTKDGWSEVDAEPTWSVLQQVTRDRLLQAPVRLQGQERAVTLRDVIGSHHQSDVMTDQVISTVCQRETEMQIGAAMPAPLDYYVQRCLQRTSSGPVNVDTLANKNILIFSYNYLLEENEFTQRFHIIRDFRAHKITAIEYPTIVRNIRNDYDMRQWCFRFRVQGISGKISMKGLEGDIKQFLPFPWICEDNIVVIEGPPGVGKSSFVTQMCSTVKKQFPEVWVLRLDMGRHTEHINGTDFTDVSRIKELLLKGLQNNPTSLERQLLEHSLTVTGNVVLFLDAFDEISPHYTNKCCDLLKGIAQMVKYRQMVVTTRPVTTKDVEEALGTKAFTLPVFSEEEQILFLKQFSAARGNHIGEKEISSLRQSAGPVLEIPLLCRMAAEVLDSQGQVFLKCLNPWRRVLLYKLFVELSIKQRVAEKFGLDITSPGIEMLLESTQTLHLQNLQGLSVRKLMPMDQLPPLSVSKETPKEKLGLVVNTGGGVDFEHQTLAEYFLGCWLACNWQQCPRQVLRRDGFEFVAVTFNWSLFDGYPLHLAVAQGDLDAVKEHLSAAGTTDTGGRTALHVAAMTQGSHREVWELLEASAEDLNRKDDVLGETAVEYAELFRNWEFVDFGLKKRANIADLKFIRVEETAKDVLLYAVEKDLVCLCDLIWRRHSDTLHNLHLLHLAAANSSKHVMQLLIERNHKIHEINQTRLTPLDEASRCGHVEAVRVLVEAGADVNIKTKDGDTALSRAAREGHLEVVKVLLDKGADFNIKNEDGDTALTWAASEGHLNIVKVFLDKGADVNIKTEAGYTALMMAAFKGHLDVMKVILDKGADVNIKTEEGDTVLTLAAWADHLNVVKALSDKGAEVNMKTKGGYTALSRAAREGNLDVLNVLLDKGADVNMKTDDGYSALTLAAREGHLDVVKLLLDKEADVNIKTEDGYTALSRAAREGNLDVMKVLLDKGADFNIKTEYGDTALSMAAWEGHLDVVKVLLDKGANVNLHGHTVLMVAAFKGHLDVVKVLLDKGADVDIKTEDGDTALTLAALAGNLNIVNVLLDKGADVNMKSKDGYTALSRAAGEGYLDVMQVLLDKGADFNIKTKAGNTALTLAALKGHLDVVKVLLDKGANVNMKTEAGYTALTLATREGHLNVVKVLLDKGADVNMKTEDGYTALALAAWKGHLDVVKILLNKEADVNIKTEGGYTALSRAAKDGHLQVVKVLIDKGSDVNIRNENSDTALTLAAWKGHLDVVMVLLDKLTEENIKGDKALIPAAREGHVDVVKILLDKGADVNINSASGNTALTLASFKGHPDVVNLLLVKGADVNKKTEAGYTALTFASMGGHLNVVKVLLDKRADVNINTEVGNTALTLAAREGHLDIVKVLLDNGSDVNIKTEGGNTAMTLAAREGHLGVVKVLLDNGSDVNIKTDDGYTALSRAARECNLDIVNVLLDKGADVNMKSDDGYTALSRAAWDGHLDIVKVLLDKGADVNMAEDGCTDLTFAAFKGHPDVVKLLLDKGSDVNMKTKDGDTALTFASMEGHLNVVKVLLDNESDVNIRTEDGYTALTFASMEGHLNVVKVLLDKGADVSIKTEYGNTPLTLAARDGHLNVVKVLLDTGADVNIKNECGNTPLTLAAMEGHLEIVKVLLDKGADVNLKNEDGDTAMCLASLGGHLDVVTFLSGLL